MGSEHRYRWLWAFLKIVIVFGLLWLSDFFYPHEKLSWLIIVAIALVFEWFFQPRLERWIKELVKQALLEKQLADEAYAQQQGLEHKAEL